MVSFDFVLLQRKSLEDGKIAAEEALQEKAEECRKSEEKLQIALGYR